MGSWDTRETQSLSRKYYLASHDSFSMHGPNVTLALYRRNMGHPGHMVTLDAHREYSEPLQVQPGAQSAADRAQAVCRLSSPIRHSTSVYIQFGLILVCATHGHMQGLHLPLCPRSLLVG